MIRSSTSFARCLSARCCWKPARRAPASCRRSHGLPEDVRVGIGVVNQKHAAIETKAAILTKAREAVRLFGPERVLLTPDCGFATFADNPIASAEIAMAKLAAIAAAAAELRKG